MNIRSRETVLARGLITLLLMVGAFTTVYAQDSTETPEAPETGIEATVMSMPGELVDVGGYQLHIYCLGEGSPTVVLDAGAGDWSLAMLPLQQQLAEFTRTCVYDRAGNGWSEAGPLPVTAQGNADALYALLTNAEIEAPYVLVGHSYGGLNVRLLASQHSESIAGVVLIDARPPGMRVVESEQFPEVLAMFQQQIDSVTPFIELLQSEPIPPEAAAQFVPEEFVPATLPTELRQTYKQQLATLGYLEAMVSLIENLEVSEEQVAGTELGDIPLVVLVAGEPGASPMGTEQAAAMQQAWIALQEEQATISTQSTVILVEDSGHYIYVDQPQIVIDAIREIVEAARTE
ncbi:MAG: alpha/beta hydrolase [Burkholderiales bacterium]|nr:alpha/beta hydrolase [Anaerolineae bacterium]